MIEEESLERIKRRCEYSEYVSKSRRNQPRGFQLFKLEWKDFWIQHGDDMGVLALAVFIVAVLCLAFSGVLN